MTTHITMMIDIELKDGAQEAFFQALSHKTLDVAEILRDEDREGVLVAAIGYALTKIDRVQMAVLPMEKSDA